MKEKEEGGRTSENVRLMVSFRDHALGGVVTKQ